MNRKKFLGLAVAASAIAGQAVAADLPSRKAPPMTPYLSPVRAYDWSGIYWGSQIGYTGMVLRQTETDYAPATGGFAGGPVTNYTASGLTIGSHLGYQAQFNSFVVGLEADFDGPFIKAGVVYTTPFATTGYQRTDFTNTLRGALRGRIGVASDRLLTYITGGLAVGGFQSIETGGFGAFQVQKYTRLGWTLGGGVEYALNNDWSMRAEYRYSDFGRLNMTTFQAMPGNQFSTRVTDNEGRLGVTYHWRGWGGGPVVARY